MRALLLSSWLLLAALALTMAITVTGAAYPLMWPVAAVALVGWIESFASRGRPLAITAATGFVLSAFFWLTFLLFLELVLGFHLSHFKILVLFAFVLALTPLLVWSFAAREARWSLAAIAVVIAGAAVVADQTPAYAPNHPRGQNITYYDDGKDGPRWLVDFEGPPDRTYLKAMGFPAAPSPYLYAGVLPSEGTSKPAADLKLEPPRLVVDQVMMQDKFQLLRGSIHGARGALQITLGFKGQSGIQSVQIAGQPLVGASRLNQADPLFARLSGFGTHEIPIEIVYDPAKKPEIVLVERAPLPDSPEANALTAARAADAAPVHNGDSAVVVHTYTLESLVPATAAQP